MSCSVVAPGRALDRPTCRSFVCMQGVGAPSVSQGAPGLEYHPRAEAPDASSVSTETFGKSVIGALSESRRDSGGDVGVDDSLGGYPPTDRFDVRRDTLQLARQPCDLVELHSARRTHNRSDS